MGLISVLLFGFAVMFTTAVFDYFSYEAMVADYNEWMRNTNINTQ